MRVKTGERPWIYGLMIGPSAVLANGVVQGGVLGYLLSRHGVGSGGQSHMIFLLALPTSLYFLWSPITDFFVRRRSWLLGGGLAAAALVGLAFQQKNLSGQMSMLLMLVSACCVQLVVSSCGGMMGAMGSEMVKRKASSFYQAGAMGFGALSAWMLVWLSSRVSQGTLGLELLDGRAIGRLESRAATTGGNGGVDFVVQGEGWHGLCAGIEASEGRRQRERE